MKKFIVMFLAVAAVFPIQAAAQGPAQMIAYDTCGSDYTSGFGSSSCFVVLKAVEGPPGVSFAAIEDGADPAWSPDGSRIAIVMPTGLFVLSLSDWSLTSLHNTGASPAWSPDGAKLAFAAGELYAMSANGSNIVQLTNNVGFLGQPAWSQDGGTIAFDCEVDSGNRDICAINTDGTGFRRLTFDPGWDSDAAFSPDGFSIALATTLNGWGPQIAIMNLNGTGITPVGGGIYGNQPAWSPDGNRIAFVVPTPCDPEGFYWCDDVYSMNRDGTGLAWIAGGNRPAFALAVSPVAWFYSQERCNGLDCSLDGSGSWGGSGGIMSYTWNFGDGMNGSGPTVTHTYAAAGTYRVTLTVTDGAGISSTQSRDLDVSGNIWPTASFTHACVGPVCTFDGSGSSDPDGSIAYYFWDFGDSHHAIGVTASHTYTSRGVYPVSLTVTDNAGVRTTQSRDLDMSGNIWPTASFTHACVGAVCAFNGSGSSDPDGSIANYFWTFGDGTTGSGVTPIHTYAATGSYVVGLTVTDNFGATAFRPGSVTVVVYQLLMHIGDLDRARTNQQNAWTAVVTITVHDGNHVPVANATVSGSWSVGATGLCTTDGTGKCLISKSAIPKKTKSVAFTIVNVTKPNTPYGSVDNHDPDGDSNGTSITVSNQ